MRITKIIFATITLVAATVALLEPAAACNVQIGRPDSCYNVGRDGRTYRGPQFGGGRIYELGEPRSPNYRRPHPNARPPKHPPYYGHGPRHGFPGHGKYGQSRHGFKQVHRGTEKRYRGTEREYRGTEKVFRGTERVFRGTERVYTGSKQVYRCAVAINRATGERIVLGGNC